MGGFFGIASTHDVVLDVYFGTDYHSHLGTKSAGLAFWGKKCGFNREIHSITNVPFRSRFENDLTSFNGTSGIGCISDNDPQPLLVKSKLGLYCISTVGIITNTDKLVEKCFEHNCQQFMAMSSGKVNTTELVAGLINQKGSIEEGILYAHDVIEGSITILILKDNGNIIAARDKFGRLPVIVGALRNNKKQNKTTAHCVTFESFVCSKLNFEQIHELGPGEIVELSPTTCTTIVNPYGQLKICAFLWTYYGYPNSTYEGVNVECMRNKNGEIMARSEKEHNSLPNVDCIAGMPDSGVPHAIGYANESNIRFARPFIKYTPTWPRSFMPSNQEERNRIAKMKQIPVDELIKDKKLMFVDDSIVRGTQLRETVDLLYSCGAKEVHMRSACPPIMHSCKYLNFSRGENDMDLLTRRSIQELEGDEGQEHLKEYSNTTTHRNSCMLNHICKSMGFDSLGYQSLDGLVEAIGLPKSHLCTYCWDGKE